MIRIAYAPDHYAEWWTGSRTINLYRDRGDYQAPIDCISFGYEKPDNSTTQLEMLAVLMRHLEGVYPVDECHICGEPIDRSNAPWRTDTCGLRCAAIAVTEDECQHAEWRWLDCEACRDSGDTCDVKVCVECGSSFMGEEA